MKWLAAFSILLVFAYVVYQTNIYVLIRYQRHGENDNVFIRIFAWRGFLSYVIKMPIVQVNWQDEMLWFESEMKETKGNRRLHTVFERHVIKKVVDFICYHPRRFQHIVKKFTKKLQQTNIVIRDLHDKVRCDRLVCRIQFGMDDAAMTAWSAGTFWLLRGLLGNALRARMSYGVSPVCIITPIFGKDVLSINLECILRIRLGNIIHALLNADKQGG